MVKVLSKWIEESLAQYIDSLESGDAMTSEEWNDYIIAEGEDVGNPLSEDERNFVIEVLANDGFVKEVREIEEMPFDKVFSVDGNEEFCHSTGYEVMLHGQWWNEYVDRNGDLHYGR